MVDFGDQWDIENEDELEVIREMEQNDHLNNSKDSRKLKY